MITNGEANSFGFSISDEEKKVNSKWKEKFFYILIFLSFITIISSVEGIIVYRSEMFIGVAVLIVDFFILFYVFYCRVVHLKEWHAAEHMLAYVLDNEEELNLENLKKAPMQHPYCGSKNVHLEYPSDKKLKEALKVGQRYLNYQKKEHKILDRILRRISVPVYISKKNIRVRVVRPKMYFVSLKND